MQKVTNALDFCFKIFASLALVVMVGLVFYNAVLRYVFNSSMPAAEELSRFMFVWVSFLGIVVANKTGSHVSVTLLTDILKGPAKIVVCILRNLVILATMAVILYGSMRYTLGANYLTPATKTNFMFVTSSAVIMSVALLAMSISTTIKELWGSGYPSEQISGEKGDER